MTDLTDLSPEELDRLACEAVGIAPRFSVTRARWDFWPPVSSELAACAMLKAAALKKWGMWPVAVVGNSAGELAGFLQIIPGMVPLICDGDGAMDVPVSGWGDVHFADIEERALALAVAARGEAE
jgi:hypothetical protein